MLYERTLINTISIIETIPAPFLVLDKTLRLTALNRLASILIKKEATEALGLSVSEILPQSLNFIKQAILSGRNNYQLVLTELPGCMAQIINHPVDHFSTLTIFDSSFISWVTSQAADPLSGSFRSILEASADGLAIADNLGTIIFTNQASADNLGLPIEELLGLSAESLISRGILDQAVSPEVIMRKTRISQIVRTLRTKKIILATGSPVLNSEGEINLIIINEQDVTHLANFSKKQSLPDIDRSFKERTQNLAEVENPDFLSANPKTMDLVQTAIKLAHLGVQRLLIEGESGTGKGLLAKYLHKISPWSQGPFISINCAALPDQLLEAELFGYEKGAFTGAAPKGKPGLFELAGSGTIFLDEIGDIPLSLQAKLLTFLDDLTFIRIGGTKILKSNCAVLAATNQNLRELVSQKLFRQDLYYRLSHFTLTLPPLRERPEDIELLAHHELHSLNKEYRLNRTLSAEAIHALKNHSFPGNVRELLSLLRQAVILSKDDDLVDWLYSVLPGKKADPGQIGPLQKFLPGNIQPVDEKKILTNALAFCHNTREMARFLGISQPTVSRRLKKHGLKAPGSIPR